MHVRPAHPEDAATCTAIARAAYAPFVPLIGREPPPVLQDFPADIADGAVWVTGDPVEGYVVARHGPLWLLENIAIAPAAQGTGMGRALIAHVETMARQAGADGVKLYTNAKMTANLRLYPQLGYSQIDRRIEFGLDRVYFEKHFE